MCRHKSCKCSVGNLQRLIRQEARIGKAFALCKAQKVIPIECTPKAFAVEYRIIVYRCGDPAVRIDIRKIEFTAVFE